jgi:hypothetical protein
VHIVVNGSNAGQAVIFCLFSLAGYPLHSPVSPTLPLPCVTVCHQVSILLYRLYTTGAVWPTDSGFRGVQQRVRWCDLITACLLFLLEAQQCCGACDILSLLGRDAV